ncbi:UvrD-helicase domain-containing protein [Pectobacterium polaris]|uniref:UvrD-helicase domain-containing protein n=1 Tax=Pectobacterium polaris TaxID=2042057 RepID=UPI0032EBAC00
MDFSIDNKQKEVEEEVTNNIRQLIKNRTSFYFIAGAGSGKTHALIDGVNEFIKLKHLELRSTGQKALCITYTNNAANEIKNRIGNENFTEISTIHSFLWETINVHMHELLEEHVIYLKEEVLSINSKIYTEDNNKKGINKLRSLGKDQVTKIIEKLLNDQSAFYDAYNSNAETFWEYLDCKIGSELLESIKSSAKDIGDAFKNLIKSQKYQNCIDNILSNNSVYQELKYFSSKNIESLHNNIIGHDTLLKYSSRIFRKYPILSEKIIDSHPIIFVDEFQDSEDTTLAIFLELLRYAKDRKKFFCLGFFGDPMQAIYNKEKHTFDPNMVVINKNINRRSHQSIVNCINKIRGENDSIYQHPINIYKTECDLSLEIRPRSEYSHESINSEILKYKGKWNINNDNKLSCLVLKNNMLSELCGFGELFNLINEVYNTEFAKGFEMVSSEFLFTETRNAGRLPIFLYEMILPLYIVKNKNNYPLSEVFSSKHSKKCNLNELIQSARFLNDLGFITLYDYICDFVDKKENAENLTVNSRNVIESVVNFNIQSIDIMVNDIYYKCKFKKIDKTKGLIRKILLTDIQQFYLWLDYLFQSESLNDISYLTCHASKGLEFDNVIIFMDDSFNRKKNYISGFLKSNIDEILDEQLESARRVFYVSCSRAIKNLRVYLYTETGENIDTAVKLFSKNFD